MDKNNLHWDFNQVLVINEILTYFKQFMSSKLFCLVKDISFRNGHKDEMKSAINDKMQNHSAQCHIDQRSENDNQNVFFLTKIKFAYIKLENEPNFGLTDIMYKVFRGAS